MIAALIALALTMPASEACAGPFTMDSRHIGPLQIGQPVSELNESGLNISAGKANEEGVLYPRYKVTICSGIKIAAGSHDGDKRIDALATTSQAFVTAQGAHIGMTLGQLKRLYPKGQFVYGDSGSPYASFMTGDGVYFEMDTRQIPQDCYADASKCDGGKLNALRAIGVHM